VAVEAKDAPTMLVLSRQDLPTLEGTTTDIYNKVSKGAYVISPAKQDKIDVVLIAAGSEVQLAVGAQEKLAAEGISASVVSMPSMDLFEKQSNEYKQSVLPKEVTKRVAVEMGSSFGWHKYVGLDGEVISIDTFGASAPGNLLMEKFGFTVDHVVSAAKKVLQ
jgi:transketolase